MEAELERRIIHALLGQPLVGNAFRGTLVEAMLAQALEPEWRWCADGWGSYDFERADGIGLEVKQSAALQTWNRPGDRFCQGKFDIGERTGRYEDDGSWTEQKCRFASVYVFAWHGVQDFGVADHRKAQQWRFYVVAAARLPIQKSITLSRIATLAEPVSIGDVTHEVSQALMPASLT